MKTKTLFLVLILSSISFFVNAQLAGKTFQMELWEMGTFNLKFSEKTYEVLNPMGEVLVKGDYKIEEDIITLNDHEGPMACPESDKGKYRFSLKEGQFKMDLISDNCGGRSNIASGTWKQIEK
ncbi:MAG: hypothetical protein JXR31_10660 [Prolixibacteraceae bacterium]|nr:hypothetical protein [Prolixibacteraceae bacterium]